MSSAANRDTNQDTRAPEYNEREAPLARRPVISATQARQGVTGQNVRYVLAFGLAAVIVAFLIVYLVYV